MHFHICRNLSMLQIQCCQPGLLFSFSLTLSFLRALRTSNIMNAPQIVILLKIQYCLYHYWACFTATLINKCIKLTPQALYNPSRRTNKQAIDIIALTLLLLHLSLLGFLAKNAFHAECRFLCQEAIFLLHCRHQQYHQQLPNSNDYS